MRIPGVRYVQGRNSYPDRDGRKFGIAIHNTSNDASDEGEASYATRRTDGISSHLYVDGDSVTQSLDLDARAGHSGSQHGNENGVAVEITGANGWSRQRWMTSVAWDKLGAALAWVIRNDPDYAGFQVRRATVAEMRANPKVKALYGHDDMRRAWGGTTHTDPGPNFPWDRLIQAITTAVGVAGHTDDTASPPSAHREDDTMNTLMRWDQSAAVFLTDGKTARWVHDEQELAHIGTLHTEGTLPLRHGGKIRVVNDRRLIGVIVGDVPGGFNPNS